MVVLFLHYHYGSISMMLPGISHGLLILLQYPKATVAHCVPDPHLDSVGVTESSVVIVKLKLIRIGRR